MGRKTHRARNIAYLVLFLGIALTVMGARMGQYRDIFGKAIMVCLECVGIG